MADFSRFDIRLEEIDKKREELNAAKDEKSKKKAAARAIINLLRGLGKIATDLANELHKEYPSVPH